MTPPAVQYSLDMPSENVRAIHAYYEVHTRRKYRLDTRIEAGWIALLSIEGVTMEDVQIVIRYLFKRVSSPDWRGPRHPGCLKLNQENFFNPQKFQDDLAEARSILAAHKTKSPKAAEATANTQPAPEHNPEISAGLRDLRSRLKGEQP